MSKTLTPSATFVTVRDSKGRKFLEVAGAAYDKALLTKEEAQRVNEAGGLSELIANHIAQHRHEVPPVLKLVTSGIKVAGAKRFVADKDSLKEANVGWTGENFNQFFLGKVEENVQDGIIAIHRLEKRSVDAPIRKELGQEREEIALAHFFDLLKKQSKGQEGHLLVNGYANIAYIKDKNGNFWAVGALWHSYYRYWSVYARSVGHPRGWRAGDQVLSSDC
ncbi:MAG: hypothetical protein A3A98_03630 [Candidatus Staskawiczbacteria bacterium RIFCSPLOWO2_01_FULL_40_39]|uniref:Uncharacterized protein n=1 Tax=Candidatus Staskawiczbacteria bacterium RIFCSPHIGHO2_01_FULL_39_25 TaxID=1802202 RepID=A0A1G2HNA6_9BACT|nr:MAG: hypothetical protein A2730_02855 [Candidatus Staskawiczbacteria bacterium RIFCSPHIGHO2_01_FULL_39_25]OGZ73810.1 MAG: hypothetical protein A3A98_03630 [Candidatus Staskawiczbacteria bacterium RIFCSPLOWO2_01_FULL_40_39]OGZ76645.1 MAG: hypothetical protein A3I87_02925 [Candidatus Staskawiczbacteria bacterium RIFCSPLOWO2_02_FULL_39_8]